MKTYSTTNFKIATFFLMSFLVFSQVNYAQKNIQKVIINKGNNVVPKVANANCDCDKIDFKVRIIKLSPTGKTRTYKLQFIDFVNKNNCAIKFFNLNWKGQQMIPMTSMKNATFEKASDGSTGLYEFEFNTKTNAIEPEDGSPISTSILIKIGEKSCFIRDKQATYYSRM